ncbi:MAG: hypothetical protein PHH59_09805 [Methylovulum sp.]|uniref:hypothetical protein n=1 Tax=Methylovulum sp. TaxID=1916980 RepID=UPI0026042D4F|nr:hypothetical protein [Methylovulum sp.]MDD2724300.1 hypothetical protein [Methylovulum sp.]
MKFPGMKYWLFALTLSALFHILIFYLISVDLKFSPGKRYGRIPTQAITLFLVKRPMARKPLPDKEPARALNPVQGSSKVKSISGLAHKQTSAASDKLSKNHHIHAAKVPQKTTDNMVVKPVYRDWRAMTEEYVQQKFAADVSRKQQQEALWLKTPSIMHGDPPDHFDKQNKAAMLIETGHQEKKRLNFNHQKSSGIRIPLGKSCSLGDVGHDQEKGLLECRWRW